jgi:hypothetical protein
VLAQVDPERASALANVARPEPARPPAAAGA